MLLEMTMLCINLVFHWFDWVLSVMIENEDWRVSLQCKGKKASSLSCMKAGLGCEAHINFVFCA